jgi:hypothetical protein
MEPTIHQVSTLPALARRVGTFSVIFVTSLFACPLLAIGIHRVLPRVVANFLFFWPQLALAPYGFTHPASDMTRTYPGSGWNYAITGAFWLVVGFGLSWLLLRKPIRTTALAALPVSFAIAIAAAALLEQLNIGIYFEGP